MPTSRFRRRTLSIRRLGTDDPASLTRFVLGEVGEDYDYSEVPLSSGYTGSEEPAHFAARTVEQLEAEERRASGIPVRLEPTPSPPRLRLARLLHAADVQTEAEEKATAVPVPLDIEAEDRPRLYGLGVERVMGLSDALSVSFLERGLQATRSVARCVRRDARDRPVAYATGLLVSPRLLLTCHHVLPDQNDAGRASAEFNYQDNKEGLVHQLHGYALDPETFFVTDPELDYTLVAIGAGFNTGEQFPWQRLSDSEALAIVGEWLSIIQHPDGSPKQVVLREHRLVAIGEQARALRVGDRLALLRCAAFQRPVGSRRMHRASRPKRDPEGRLVALDGTPWSPEMGLPRLRWAAHEAVLARSVVRHLTGLKLPDAWAALRDELLYLTPHLWTPPDVPAPVLGTFEAARPQEVMAR